MNIEDLSFDELKEQAEILGVAFPNNIKEETLRKKIQEKLGEPEDEPALAHPTVKSNGERVTIIINESETDKQPVTVGVNGRNYVMQRGKPVSVPMAVVEILNHAVKQVWDAEMKGYSKVMRYPYSVAAQ